MYTFIAITKEISFASPPHARRAAAETCQLPDASRRPPGSAAAARGPHPAARCASTRSLPGRRIRTRS
eukprot:3758404-Rhodomonas_salina.2